MANNQNNQNAKKEKKEFLEKHTNPVILGDLYQNNVYITTYKDIDEEGFIKLAQKFIESNNFTHIKDILDIWVNDIKGDRFISYKYTVDNHEIILSYLFKNKELLNSMDSSIETRNNITRSVINSMLQDLGCQLAKIYLLDVNKTEEEGFFTKIWNKLFKSDKGQNIDYNEYVHIRLTNEDDIRKSIDENTLSLYKDRVSYPDTFVDKIINDLHTDNDTDSDSSINENRSLNEILDSMKNNSDSKK